MPARPGCMVVLWISSMNHASKFENIPNNGGYMKYVVIIALLLTAVGLFKVHNGLTDQKCLMDCIREGYSYGFCQNLCEY